MPRLYIFELLYLGYKRRVKIIPESTLPPAPNPKVEILVWFKWWLLSQKYEPSFPFQTQVLACF